MRIIQSFSIFFLFPETRKNSFIPLSLRFVIFNSNVIFTLSTSYHLIQRIQERTIALLRKKKKKGKFWITHCHQHEITTKLQRSSKIIWKIPLKFLRLLFTLNHRHGNKSTHQQWIESTISFERRLKIADVVIHGSTFPTLHDCLYPI